MEFVLALTLATGVALFKKRSFLIALAAGIAYFAWMWEASQHNLLGTAILAILVTIVTRCAWLMRWVLVVFATGIVLGFVMALLVSKIIPVGPVVLLVWLFGFGASVQLLDLNPTIHFHLQEAMEE